jgi:hypothetical protein
MSKQGLLIVFCHPLDQKTMALNKYIKKNHTNNKHKHKSPPEISVGAFEFKGVADI